MKYYKCGQILKTHGIKGDLKIKEETDFNRFSKGNTLYILYNDEYIKVIVNNVKEFQNGLLVSFKDMLDINLVEKFHGCNIYVSEEDRGELESGFYYNEIIGLPIYNENNELRGKVINIIEYPHAKYLEVESNGKTSLIPFIDEFILDVLENKIIIKEIEGLL